jgi:cytoskeletal protein CcmA (bactofilin family)
MIDDCDFKDFNYNVLGANSRIVGELFLAGDSIVNATVEGSIEVQGPGKLVLERGSVVHGKIRAVDLEIFGTVVGEIDCTGLVAIRSSAHVEGAIRSGRLVIYPGAVVEMQASSQQPT